ncbi:MAG: hypothetical protein PHD67_03110 [Oscillospiraceae bacterium]|nr:hypothetical protein [Oscillospiraceae bacterium]
MKKFCAVCAALLAFGLWGMAASALGEAEYLTIEREVEEENVSFSYRYPKVVQAKTPQAQSLFNAMFREYGEWSACEALRRGQKSAGPITGSLDFRVGYNTPALLSVVFITRIDGEQPRAHSLNLDGESGRTVRLCDLFQGEEQRRAAAALFARAAQGRKLPEELCGKLGVFRNNQPYYLTGTELVLLLERGEAFPGETGTMELALKKTDLGALLQRRYQN